MQEPGVERDATERMKAEQACPSPGAGSAQLCCLVGRMFCEDGNVLYLHCPVGE